jgi:hypothetical protein
MNWPRTNYQAFQQWISLKGTGFSPYINGANVCGLEPLRQVFSNLPISGIPDRVPSTLFEDSSTIDVSITLNSDRV